MPNKIPDRIFTPDFVRLSVTSFIVFATFQGLMAVIGPFMLAHHMTVAEVGETGAAFLLTAVLIRPLVGRELDRRGRLLLFRVGLTVIAVSFVLYPWAIHLIPLTILRILHGVGWGLASTAAATLIQDIVPPARRGEATGYYANFTDLAMAFGPFLAVAILTRFGFGPFSWAAAAALVAALGLVWSLPETHSRMHHPNRRLITPAARWPALIQLLMNINFGAVMTFLPVIAVRRHLMHPVFGVAAYGYFYLVYALTLLVLRSVFGRWSDRFGRRAVILPGLAVLAVAAGWAAFMQGLPMLLGFALLFGIGYGSAQPAVLAWTMDITSPQERGTAAGTYYAAFDLGIGLAALGFGPLAQATSFHLVFYVAGAATLLSLILAFRVVRHANPQSPATVP